MEYQQHYPTYKFEHRDVLLAEFEEAQSISNSQSKLYGQLANILIAFITVGLTMLLNSNLLESTKASETILNNLIPMNLAFLGVGLVILRYFIELQRTIVINCRKVITLRLMLGLNYGHLQLTIPNWRVEGATNPFVVKLFPGWLKFGSSPFWVIIISLNILWYYSSSSLNTYDYLRINWWIYSVVLTLLFTLIYRLQLRERHETLLLIITKAFGSITRIKLLPNFEYIIYRAKLAVYELDRLEYDLENLKPILISIEDRKFMRHKGINFKSLLRSLVGTSPYLRRKFNLVKSGGSTISMQLARSLFIPSNQPKIRRKLVEILLAIWMDKVFSKREILYYYLVSVRYERGVIGIIPAINYFFPEKIDAKIRSLTNEEGFFLVERLSNITSTYRKDRIEYLVKRCSLSPELNFSSVMNIYEMQHSAERIQEIDAL